MWWYFAVLAAVAAERLAELVVARRNAVWTRGHSAVEYGRRHYPLMVVLHTGLLVGCLVEVAVTERPFLPLLAGSMLVLVVLSQALRWWCIGALGRYWNTRVLVVPGARPVRSGPYRLLRHPNYLAVVVEGAALPLVHSAWMTAVAFTVANAVLLVVRVRCENAALTEVIPA